MDCCQVGSTRLCFRKKDPLNLLALSGLLLMLHVFGRLTVTLFYIIFTFGSILKNLSLVGTFRSQDRGKGKRGRTTVWGLTLLPGSGTCHFNLTSIGYASQVVKAKTSMLGEYASPLKGGWGVT